MSSAAMSMANLPNLSALQSSVLQSLTAAQPASSATASGSVSLSVSGLDPSSHASVFGSQGSATQTANTQPTDFSAIMLEDWLEGYLRERDNFQSVSLFCEIKLRELIELTNTLHVESSDNPATVATAQTRSVPSKLRTAVCIDLLDILIASIAQPEKNPPPASPTANGHTSSRQALGHLLLKLRDELVKSIYVQPTPAHLLLQYSPFFTRQHSLQRGNGGGSVTQRGRGVRNEEKEFHTNGSMTSRAKKASTALIPSLASSPPSCVREFLRCQEWFSMIPQHVARNRLLAEQARIIMIPSKLFRLRQIQKKVVGNMTQKWRDLLLKWKFWEWREMIAQKKQDKLHDRASKIATRLTDNIARLECRVHFYQWRQLVVYRKYKSMRDAKQKGLANNAELAEETYKLSEETHLIREEIARLDQSNNQLSTELKLLRNKLENSQVDLQDTSKHQQQCSELLEALRAPLKAVFQAIAQQIESFNLRDFTYVHPLLTTVVDQEFQQQLEQLGLPGMPGMESWALVITQGSNKHRVAVCAQLVARWLALQLKLCGSVLAGGAGNYSEYLVKLENQQRIAAALARVRQLSSANPPTTLPPFPVVHRKKAADGSNSPQKSPTSSTGTSLLGGGVLPMTRGRPRAPSQLPGPTVQTDAESKDGEGDLISPTSGDSKMKHRNSRLSLKKASLSMKLEELPPPPPGSDSAAKAKRLQEGHAIPTGTLSTPLRVFQQLRDSDRPETIFAVSAVALTSDNDVAKSLKLPQEKRWSSDENAKVSALRSLMDTLRVTPEMTLSEMESSVTTVNDGIESAHSVFTRTRSAQARLQAVEDEIFAQSVKLLHQQSQRKHRVGEKENNMPTDLLDIDLTVYPDVAELSSISKSEVAEANKVYEEYCRDLYKIFVFYCNSATANTTAAGLLSTATQSEPRMGNAEFWRFVRDCKLKLQQTALIDTVFTRVSDRNALLSDGTDAAAAASLPAGAATSTLSMLANMTEGMSLSESERLAERYRQSDAKDISFVQFGQCLLRLSMIKYPNEKMLGRKIKNLLITNVLPNSSQKAATYHKQQLAAAQSLNPSSSPAAGAGGAAGVGANVNLNTLEVDQVFRKYNVLLRQIFQIYARITPQFMTMTFNDFLGFAREFELLHKYVTQHDLKQLFSNVIRDMSGGEGDFTNLTGGGATGTNQTPTLAAAMDKAGKAALKRATTVLSGGALGGDETSGATGEDGDSGAPPKELSYRQFLELLAAVSHYVIRNPYYALHDRVDKFIASVIASRKKLPTKVYRSAV